MIVTDHIVYLQLQKCASTHIAELLCSELGGIQYVKHQRMPRCFDRQDKLIIGSVRNPWEWYVSFWAFGYLHEGGLWDKQITLLTESRAQRRPADGVAKLGGVPLIPWDVLYEDPRDPGRFRTWLKAMHDPAIALQLHKNYASFAYRYTTGFCTYLYLYLYSLRHAWLYCDPESGDTARLRDRDEEQNMIQRFVRAEALEQELNAALIAAGVPPDTVRRVIERSLSTGRTNPTLRERRLAYYYDAETVDLVARRDALIIGKHGYQPPDLTS